MPELPEVETVRKALESLVRGKVIKNLDVFYPKMIKTPEDVEHFKFMLKGQRIHSIGRKGKYLLFHLDDVTLISHLRMEGKYFFSEQRPREYDKHTHVVIYFTDETVLQYRDVRKFGTMDLITKGSEAEFHALKKLGPEPIGADFNKEKFKEQVLKRKAPIKQILLNQEVVSGLGNIYVDDSLAMSKIHPLRFGYQLSEAELNLLVVSIQEVLQRAIKKGGSSTRSFESIYGRGSMQDHLIVYGRAGKPCVFCGTPIEKIKVGGRGTHFCPSCQTI